MNNSLKSILIIGGGGYVGTILTKKLLDSGYNVSVYDLFIYGNYLDKLKKDYNTLNIIQGDIRNIKLLDSVINKKDVVYNFACISNDPSAELDLNLTRSINYDAFEPIMISCKKNNIKRHIYASSSSIYGLSDSPNVDEDHPKVPVSEYNKSKDYCEKIIKKFQDDFCNVIIRPATVCGFSPRLRLDLTVNILTNFAFHKNFIKVFGGQQYRPNIHIDDLTDLYVSLLKYDDKKISGEVFNAGYQNHKIVEIAEIIKQQTKILIDKDTELKIFKSDDIRSYRITTTKIEEKLGFFPRKKIEDAASDLIKFFKINKINTMESSQFYNLKKMQEIDFN